MNMQNRKSISLTYLFLTFLKIGSISWGGFMALISVVRTQMVDKDKTIKDELVLDGISLASVLPGPVAFNVVAYIGYTLRGIPGALVSMVAIVLPSFLMIILLASLYVNYSHIDSFRHFFAGILPAVAAVIIGVAVGMFQKQVKDWKQIAICVLSCLSLIFLHSFWTTLFIIALSALAGYLLYRVPEVGVRAVAVESPSFSLKRNWLFFVGLTLLLTLILFPLLPGIVANERYQFLQTIFLTFSGMSLTLFGGGYVIIPTMQQVIVDGLHWLTVNEFADAIAMGQITPGPIFISAAFIGFRIAGFWGALVATVAIFFPPGGVMVFMSHFMNRIKDSAVITAAFKGMRPAIIGMIFSAAWTIGKSAPLTWPTGLIFAVALLMLIRFKSNAVYLIPLSGLAGILLYQI